MQLIEQREFYNGKITSHVFSAFFLKKETKVTVQ
jgi:hypothetical protein